MQISCPVTAYLISLCFCYIDRIIPLLPKSEISSLWPSSVAVQPGLCRLGRKPRRQVFSGRSSINIGIKHVFLCIKIQWVPREVLKTEGAAQGFQHRPRNPVSVNAWKNMFDRNYCIKVSKKSILERYFDVLFWHYFVLIFYIGARR